MADVIPRKLFFKIGEVCELTDTQPYVLRFWESEFPQLAPKKSRTGQRLYRRKDIDLVLEIKKLLYQEGYTIAGARKKLGMAPGEGVLADLFDPATGPEPDGAHSIRVLTAELREILRVMDGTDGRFKGKHGSGRK
jgi:DNA-binding transcriptional MerR regulator